MGLTIFAPTVKLETISHEAVWGATACAVAFFFCTSTSSLPDLGSMAFTEPQKTRS